MKIGLTYDLRSEYLADGYDEETTAEFDRDDTIAAIATALETLGHQTDRIGGAQTLVEIFIKPLAVGNKIGLYRKHQSLFPIDRSLAQARNP